MADRAYYLAHKKERLNYQLDRYKTDPVYREQQLQRSRKRHARLQMDVDYRAERKVRAAKRHADSKFLVLSHYGLNGVAVCCWKGCTEVDIDVLNLDHINNDGALDKKMGLRKTGHMFYDYVIRNNFPNGFQTLCMNHQWKKEILRRRGEPWQQKIG